MGIRRGNPVDFFGASRECATVLAERRHWLNDNPEAYLGVLPGGETLVDEFLSLSEEWQMLPAEERQLLKKERDPLRRLQKLSERVEPDLLFLAPGQSGQMELLAGAVCFPSAWRLSEKLGRPMAAIHGPAPGLNSSLGNQIDVFLSRLRPGVAWLRSNWGLSASAELNQHPDRRLPRLSPELTLDQVWLRVERQALLLLPSGGGIFFGLRIETEPLDAIKRESPEAAGRLAHALSTMPETIAQYKGIATARESLVAQLRS